ncbi:MAG: hypothetical protein Q7T92_12455 [Lutibacter sp.]|nr:hypothetical protein [Lutibacter sp.]
MENISINTAIDNLEPNKIKTDFQTQNATKNLVYEHLENYLNSRILKITTIIKNQYPELLEFLNEMPETIPSEMSPEITLNNLKTYGESLNSLLIKYKLEHS